MTLDDLMGKLNESQREAVESIEGPVMVVAGPGTGKTQVLAMRVAYILENTDTPPEAILALTFSNAGKQSMRERLVSIIGSTGYQVQIETFHSFAEHVIRSNPTYFAIADEKYQLVDDLEKYLIINEILERGSYRELKPLKSPKYYVKPLVGSIQELKREGYTPEAFGEKVESLEMKDKEKEKLRETARVYGEYEAELGKRLRYDYDDLINLVVREFGENEELLRTFEEKYLYLLADEYQDTNTSQNRMLFSLARFWGQQANIFVVGDPDQTIYRFQGASLENMLEFRAQFPQSKIIYLGNNYRSHQRLLDGAAGVISNNVVRGAKIVDKPWSLKSSSAQHGDKIQLVELANDSAENAFVVEEIKKLQSQGVEGSAIGVLFRNNAHGEAIARLLAAGGIPYEYGDRNLLESGVISRFLKLLSGIEHVTAGADDVQLYHCLALPWWGVDNLELVKANRQTQELRTPLFEQVVKVEELKKVVEQISEWAVRATQVPLYMFLTEVIDDSGMIPWIQNQKNSMEYMAAMRSLLNFVEKQTRKRPELTVGELLEMLELHKEYGVALPPVDLASAQEGVQLLTAHGAKGLEFEYVFIIRAIDSVWGNKRNYGGIKLPNELLANPLPKTEKYEDERRLFYVSMTRAKRRLTITMAKEYDERPAVGAMFVREIDSESVENVSLEEFEEKLENPQFHQLWLAPDQTPAQDEQKYLREVIDNGFALSYSALKDYLKCPHWFKVNNLLRIPQVVEEAALYGTIMHRLMESYWKMDNLKSMDAMIEETVNRWLVRYPDRERWVEDLKSNFQVVVNKYLSGVGKPERTELAVGRHQPVVWEGVPIQGKIDRVDWLDKNAKTVRVVDYKTTDAKSRNALLGLTQDKESSTYVDQLRFYALLLNSAPALGYKPKEMSVVFLAPTKTKDPDIKQVTFDVEDDEAMETLKARVHEVWDGISNLKFEHADGCECEK